MFVGSYSVQSTHIVSVIFLTNVSSPNHKLHILSVQYTEPKKWGINRVKMNGVLFGPHMFAELL